MNGLKIRAAGHCVPQQIVTNDDLAMRMDTSDEWISIRTGIRRRRHCTTETQTGLCIEAARRALELSGSSPEEIGVCIVATCSPESVIPSTACMVQQALGLEQSTLCFDLNAACSGFIYALHTAQALLAQAKKKLALVIGGEALSRITNWEDRSSCILFGDGAGAVVVESRAEWPSIGAVTGCMGNAELLYAAGPGSGKPTRIAMEGTKVFRFAVETISACMEQVLAKHGASMAEVDWFVFHQANARIIDLVRRKHGIPQEKLYMNVDEYGNTSAASIPIALSEMQEKGLARPGDRVLMVGFGGGLTWGGALVQIA